MSAARPRLEENGRTLLLAVDNAWTGQAILGERSASLRVFGSSSVCKHLRRQRNPDEVNCYRFLLRAGEKADQLVTDELAFGFSGDFFEAGLLDLRTPRNVTKNAAAFGGSVDVEPLCKPRRASGIICILFLKESPPQKKCSYFCICLTVLYSWE